MLLRVVDGDEFRDIRIEEGEMFLLPGELRHKVQHAVRLIESTKRTPLTILCALRTLSVS